MHDIVVLVEWLTEHPKVIFIGQKVKDAQLLCIAIQVDIGNHVLSGELNPVPLHHYVNICRSGATICVENAIFLLVIDVFEHELEKGALNALWNQVKLCSGR